MSIKIILFITLIFQTINMTIPYKYLKTLHKNELSEDLEEKIKEKFLLSNEEFENIDMKVKKLRTENRAHPSISR